MNILFIDDEPFFATPYVSELENAGSKVLCAVSLDDARQCLLGAVDINAIIIDIIMPRPSGVCGSDWKDGEAGLYFLSEIKELVVQRRIPVVVLSNKAPAAVLEFIEKLNFPEGLIAFRAKIDTPKFYLPHIVRSMVSIWRSK